MLQLSLGLSVVVFVFGERRLLVVEPWRIVCCGPASGAGGEVFGSTHSGGIPAGCSPVCWKPARSPRMFTLHLILLGGVTSCVCVCGDVFFPRQALDWK